MKALKCDNCGVYFDYDKSKATNTIDFVYTDKYGNLSLNDRKNLCPACLAAVMKTLEDRKEAV